MTTVCALNNLITPLRAVLLVVFQISEGVKSSAAIVGQKLVTYDANREARRSSLKDETE